MKPVLLFILMASQAFAQEEGSSLKLYPGYLTRIECEGKLWVSAVGNDQMVSLEAFPKELGCGVLLKPRASAGQTNLILETSSGTIEQLIEVDSSKRQPRTGDLTYRLKGKRS